MRTIPLSFAGQISRLSFTSDGHELVACGYREHRNAYAIRRIDLAAGVGNLCHINCRAMPSFSADMHRHVFVDRELTGWHVHDDSTREQFGPFPLPGHAGRYGNSLILRMAADGRHVALAISGDEYARSRRDILRARATSGRVGVGSVDQSGTYLPLNSPLARSEIPWIADVAFLTGASSLMVTASLSAKLPYSVWDWHTGAKLADLTVPRDEVGRLSFSPDESLLATATERRVIVWDTLTWLPALTVTDKHRIRDFAFSPGSSQLLTAGDSTLIQLWDLSTDKLQDSYKWRTSAPTAVAFAPDGLTAAAAYDDAIMLWDIG
jgi:WD40 repeat protein